MFDTLTERFEATFARLKGRGRLGEAEVDAALREIRVALLEADVHLDVVRSLTTRIRERALSEELSKALNPGQQVVKIVLAELTTSLGGEPLTIRYASKPPTVVLLAGLQGTGKTTNAAKLAGWFRRQGRNPLLVAADLQRPGAVEQLTTLGATAEVPVFSEPTDPVSVAQAAMTEATRTGRDVVIVDTAGRLGVDAEMMSQVRSISDAVSPHYTFLVVDAMTGQDAVVAARAFHETLSLDGVILTKLDGDARGGAGAVGEGSGGRTDRLRVHRRETPGLRTVPPSPAGGPDTGHGRRGKRSSTRAEATFEAEEAEQAAGRLMEGSFTFDDFLQMMNQVLKMGNLRSIIGMMPGLGRQVRDADIDESRITRITGMIHSMTPDERADPDIIDASRRRRIAAGSGSRPDDVKALVTQFKQARSMMRNMGGGLGGKRRKARSGGPKSGISPRGGRGASRGSSTGAKGRRGAGGRTTPRKPPGAPNVPLDLDSLVLPGLEKRGPTGLN